jgi:hypothetical protein
MICVCICNGILFSHKEERSYVIHRQIDGTGSHLLIEVSQIQKTRVTCFLSYREDRCKT